MRALRICGFCAVAVVATVFCACLFAAETQPAAAKTPDLQQRVTALEEKVAQLEKKLDQLSSSNSPIVPPAAIAPYLTPRVPNAPQATPGTSQAAPQQAPPGIPRNAVPHEFNGQTYYIVPLTK